MKIRNYEKISGIYYLVGLLLFLEIVGGFYLQSIKIRKYNMYSTLLLDENERMIIADKNDKKIIYKNTYLYLNNKKIKYQIQKEEKLDNNMYGIHLSFSINQKYKKKDIVVVAIEKQKITIFEVLKNVWGGD